MLPAHKILLRYKLLDECFRSSKNWTLERLITHCSEQLKEKVSKRSIQSDIQFLRDNGATIIVQDKKYYTYEKSSYSFFNENIPEKFREQYQECVDFIQDFWVFTTSSDKTKKQQPNYIKFYKKKYDRLGFAKFPIFYDESEVRRINMMLKRYEISDGTSIAKYKPILQSLLTPGLKKIIKIINSRAFLVDTIYNLTQKEKPFEQTLHLPLEQRKIPRNMTLWGYPNEEKVEQPDKKELFKHTFAIQIFLKDIKRNTGALQVVRGSHKMELSPLEINLITNNTTTEACEVEKGGIIIHSPMLIQRIEPSESPKNKQSITLWFSSYRLPVHYIWNNEINI